MLVFRFLYEKFIREKVMLEVVVWMSEGLRLKMFMNLSYIGYLGF